MLVARQDDDDDELFISDRNKLAPLVESDLKVPFSIATT